MSGWPSDLFGFRPDDYLTLYEGPRMPKKREKAIRREKQVGRKKKSQRQKEDEERKDPPFGDGDGGGGDSGGGGDGGGDGGGEKCLEYKLTRLPLIHSDPFYLENSSRKGCSISWKTKVLLYLSAHPKSEKRVETVTDASMGSIQASSDRI
ncbi:hypothetical protein HZH66_013615 [Vespula vulgaris]|uniref:Uncharacterized protein n=1 Tax=Vespula vulgaris TaxID=7454 RepID=A0A834J5A9_VESVU|nr:hypothetical protein HZH66_013615 [Vespula vulgaris]